MARARGSEPSPDDSPQLTSVGVLIGIAALLVGSLTAAWMATNDLGLVHPDARARLVVARRVFDSVTPGWNQLGGIWLPLPLALNVPLVYSDVCYATGLCATAVSVLAFAALAGATAQLVTTETRQTLAGAFAGLAVTTQSELLFVQGTPLIETHALALILLGLVAIQRSRRLTAGLAFALACLTRYEAWPSVVAILAICLYRDWSSNERFARWSRLAIPPALAFLTAAVWSRLMTGQWLVTSGFYDDVNPAKGNVAYATALVAVGIWRVSGTMLLIAGVLGWILAARHAARRFWRSDAALALSMSAALIVSAYAYYLGHAMHARFALMVVPVLAMGGGLLVARLGEQHARFAAALAGGVLFAVVLTHGTPRVLVEASSDRSSGPARALAAQCVRDHDRGGPILVSLMSLAPFVHDVSRLGIPLARFVHEGNGAVWRASVNDLSSVQAVMIDYAHRGDRLLPFEQHDPSWLHDFQPICRAGDLVVYFGSAQLARNVGVNPTTHMYRLPQPASDSHTARR